MWRDHFLRLAEYNRWANERVFASVAELSEEEYKADRKAFFRSIHGTLNHLLAVDLLWVGRLAPPAFRPSGYDMILEQRFAALRQRRQALDRRIVDVVGGLDDARIRGPFSWTTLEGEPQSLPLSRVLTHFFNHQTHHRGQVHDMLSQTGREPPPLDFYLVMFD